MARLRLFAAFFGASLACGSFVGACSSAPARTPCSTSSQCPAGQACVDSVCVASPDSGIPVCGASCECTNDATCQAVVPACVVAACVSGSCLYRTHDERCAFGQTCDLVGGCVGADSGPASDAAAVDGGGTDAAPSDASIADGGGRDAGAPDGSLLDGGGRDAGGRDAGVDAGGPSPLGGPCRVASDCAPINGVTAQCLTMLPGSTVTLTGGYCTIPCRSLITTMCGRSGECVSASPFGSGACAALCTAPTDCRTGYTCHVPAMSSPTSTMTACLPPGV